MLRVTKALRDRGPRAFEGVLTFPFERTPGLQRRLRIREDNVVSFLQGKVGGNGELFGEESIRHAQVTLKISDRPVGYTLTRIEEIEEWSARLHGRMVDLDVPAVDKKCRTYYSNDAGRSSADVVCAGLRTASAYASSASADEEGSKMHKNLVTALITLIGRSFATSNPVRVEDVFSLGSCSSLAAAVAPDDV